MAGDCSLQRRVPRVILGPDDLSVISNQVSIYDGELGWCCEKKKTKQLIAIKSEAYNLHKTILASTFALKFIFSVRLYYKAFFSNIYRRKGLNFIIRGWKGRKQQILSCHCAYWI